MKQKDYSNLSSFDLLKMSKNELNEFKREFGIEEKNPADEMFKDLIDEIDSKLQELDSIPKDTRTIDEKIADELNIIKESIEKCDIIRVFDSFIFLANQNIKYDEWLDIKDMFKVNKKLFKAIEKNLKDKEAKIDKQFKEAIASQEKLEDLTRMTRPTLMRCTQNFYYDRKICIENAKRILKNIK